MKIDPDFSFDDAQGLNAAIYRIQNQRQFGPKGMAGRIVEASGRVLKANRKGEEALLKQNVALAFSWAMALANALEISVRGQVWKHFPAACPYCACCPCDPSKHLKDKKRLDLERYCGRFDLRPTSITDFQAMFARIYPLNELEVSAPHFVEEAIELQTALDRFCATHRYDLFPKVQEEFVDVLANAFAVFNCLKVELGTAYQEMFSDGCIDCKRVPCRCGYPIAESFSVK